MCMSCGLEPNLTSESVTEGMALLQPSRNKPTSNKSQKCSVPQPWRARRLCNVNRLAMWGIMTSCGGVCIRFPNLQCHLEGRASIKKRPNWKSKQPVKKKQYSSTYIETWYKNYYFLAKCIHKPLTKSAFCWKTINNWCFHQNPIKNLLRNLYVHCIRLNNFQKTYIFIKIDSKNISKNSAATTTNIPLPERDMINHIF